MRYLGLLALTLACTACLLPRASEAQSVEYVLGRRGDPDGSVNTVCLGLQLASAYTYLDSEKPGNVSYPGTDNNVTVYENRTGITTATNANFFYVGYSGTLASEFLCASNTYGFLYNTSAFLWTMNDPLPGSASNFSYAASIWRAAKTANVALQVKNLVDEDLQVNSSFAAILPPDTNVTLKVKGSFFDNKVDASKMLEDFTMALSTDPGSVLDNFAPGRAYAAMLMDESDGSTVYYFFSVHRGISRQCNYTWCNSTSDPCPFCVIGSAFEVQYDVSDVSFPLLHCYYDPDYPCDELEAWDGYSDDSGSPVGTLPPAPLASPPPPSQPNPLNSALLGGSRRRLLSTEQTKNLILSGSAPRPKRRKLASKPASTKPSGTKGAATTVTRCSWVNTCGTRPKKSSCYYYRCR